MISPNWFRFWFRFWFGQKNLPNSSRERGAASLTREIAVDMTVCSKLRGRMELLEFVTDAAPSPSSSTAPAHRRAPVLLGSWGCSRERAEASTSTVSAETDPRPGSRRRSPSAALPCRDDLAVQRQQAETWTVQARPAHRRAAQGPRGRLVSRCARVGAGLKDSDRSSVENQRLLEVAAVAPEVGKGREATTDLRTVGPGWLERRQTRAPADWASGPALHGELDLASPCARAKSAMQRLVDVPYGRHRISL